MKEIICFGTGYMTDVVMDFLDSLNYTVKFWIDNNPKLWGKMCGQKEIFGIDKIKECNDPIYISCIYVDEIRNQLEQLGYGSRIIDLRELVEGSDLYNVPQVLKRSESSAYIFDVADDNKWSGTELWSLRLAARMKAEKRNVLLVAAEDMQHIETESEVEVIRLKRKRLIYEMITELEEKMPVIFIDSFSRYGILAAIFLKLKYPDAIKIVTVFHCDDSAYIMRHFMYKSYFDTFFCVSERIRKRVQEEHPDIMKHLYSRMQPIEYDAAWKRIYRKDGAVRIAYAARLERKQKRAHLLPELIGLLEKSGIDYRLDIAGSGECYFEINRYISENGYERVRMLGQLEASEMPEYWKEHDVYVNFSAFEGCSLAMLEAMSYGCVPIVSDVSGVEEIIENGNNGFICNGEVLDEFANCICRLDRNRDEMMNLSIRSMEAVREKCSYKEYTYQMLRLFDTIQTEGDNNG